MFLKKRMLQLCNNLKNVISRLMVVKTQHLGKKKPTSSLEAMSTFESELLEVGYGLFVGFFEMGCAASVQKINSFKQIQIVNNNELKPLVRNIQGLIFDTEEWLHRFLGNYPDFVIRIDEHETIDKGVCQVRSGLQFMLDLFKGTGGEKLDESLKFIEDDILEYFDVKIKSAKEHVKFLVTEDDIPDSLPKSHVWWFPLK